MSKVFSDISMSLDGFIAGPDPSLKDPLGKGGEELHEWAFRLESWHKAHGRTSGEKSPENDLAQETIDRTGAVIMGRKMFSGGGGSWEKDSKADGWWGDNPPFHVPVFVLTSHPREKLIKQGGTSFTFITEGIESALSQAKEAAGDKDVSIPGGASAIQQFLKAGLLDELEVHLVPILLGGGTRLFDKFDSAKFEKIRVIDYPLVTHLKYRPKQ